MSKTKNDLKEYAVTGEVHGSIVFAKSIEQAIRTFKTMYKGERVLAVKERCQGIYELECLSLL